MTGEPFAFGQYEVLRIPFYPSNPSCHHLFFDKTAKNKINTKWCFPFFRGVFPFSALFLICVLFLFALAKAHITAGTPYPRKKQPSGGQHFDHFKLHQTWYLDLINSHQDYTFFLEKKNRKVLSGPSKCHIVVILVKKQQHQANFSVV
jgi:hypothetical protein